MTERKLEECVSNSLSVEGARALVSINYQKDQWDKAHGIWLAALKPGSVVKYDHLSSPQEVVSRLPDHKFCLKNLHDGDMQDSVYGMYLMPFTEKELYAYKHSVRLQALADKATEIIRSRDEKKIAALEAALK